MSLRSSSLILCLCSALMAGETASSLYRQARKAQAKQDYTKAYLLASRAVAADPEKLEYWNFAQSLRSRAMPGLKLDLGPADDALAATPLTDGEAGLDAPSFPSVSDSELKEAREVRPLPVLQGTPVLKDFNIRGDAKRLFELVLSAYGLSAVFDGDYQAGAPIQFRVEKVGWKEAIRSLENVTSSFVVPVSAKVAMIAKDTTQKRAEIEPVISVIIPFLEPLSPQEVQEAARAVQSTFDMTKMGIDNGRRLVLFRDRVSRLRPAMQLFQELMVHRGQVSTEVELFVINRNSSLNYGMTLPSSFPITYVGDVLRFGYTPTFTMDESLYHTIGGGSSRFALGITGADLFASMTRGQTTSLVKSELLGLEGQAAQLHVGDRYPIITASYSGTTTGTSAYAPTVNFEDLGIVLKITPHLHGTESVTLEIEAEFKALSGQTLNNIPVISERKFLTKTRLRYSETAVIAGLARDTLTQSWSGIPLLALIPGLRSNDKSLDQVQLLLSVHPRLVNLPASEFPAPAVWVGSETRPRTDLDPPAN